MWKRILLGTVVALSSATAANAQIADFEDGTTQDWVQGQGSAPAPTLATDAGPDGAGDDALAVSPSQVTARIFPHTTENQDFLGDLVGDGIVEVQFDAMAPQTNSTANIELHAVVMNTPANRWVSSQAGLVPPDGVWRTFNLSLEETDMAQPAGSNAYQSDFATVTRFGLRHQVDLGANGTALASVNDQLFLDNIQLLPEPRAVGVALGVLAALGAASRRRSPSVGFAPRDSRAAIAHP